MSKIYRRLMAPGEIDEFFRVLAAARPEPETELAYGNGYQLLVAVVLSAQATDVGVNKATKRLFEIVHTPQQMLDAGSEPVGNTTEQMAAQIRAELDGFEAVVKQIKLVVD